MPSKTACLAKKTFRLKKRPKVKADSESEDDVEKDSVEAGQSQDAPSEGTDSDEEEDEDEEEIGSDGEFQPSPYVRPISFRSPESVLERIERQKEGGVSFHSVEKRSLTGRKIFIKEAMGRQRVKVRSSWVICRG